MPLWKWVAGFSLSSQPLNCFLCEFPAEPQVMFSSCHLSGLCYWYSGRLGCWPGPQRKGFSFLFCCYPSVLEYFDYVVGLQAVFLWQRLFWEMTSFVRLEHQGGQGGYELLLFLFGFDKLQVCTRTLGCLWAVSLVRSPKAEISHIWNMYFLCMDCVSMPPSPSSSIFFHCLI